MSDARAPITAELAAWAAGSSYETLPRHIQVEAMRAFLNWFGCAAGGSTEPVAKNSLKGVMMTGGAPQASVIGMGTKTDTISAAFVNCVSSSAQAYDDTHLATVTHPTGPVAAAVLAHAETTKMSGRDLLNAVAIGIEIECRLSNTLLMPPAEANLSLYVTGVTGGIGAAAAMGRVMGLDERQMRWAMGYAATQGAGFRATHAAMSGLVVPGFAARAGLFAAHLAASGVECREDTIEAPKGFVEIYAKGADLGHATRGLGTQWEVLANAYKPYPCGIVVQPSNDAIRDIAEQLKPGDVIEEIKVWVHPLTIGLSDRPEPKSMFEAHVSFQHWSAWILLKGSWGVEVVEQSALADPEVAALRKKVVGIGDASLARDQSRAEVRLADGRVLKSWVEHARGSIDRPMTDAELDEKFLKLCGMAWGGDRPAKLLALMRDIAGEADVGRAVGAALA